MAAIKLTKLYTQITKTITEKKSAVSLQTVWTNPIHYTACCFGIGCLPLMPGTYATILSVGLYLILVKFSIVTFISILILLNIAGIWLCGKTNKDIGCNDHPAACFDELATFPICLIGVPFSWTQIIIAFILFRVLDILKPPPINYIDKNMHGGLGVMLDDVVAALITLACMHFLLFFH